MTLTWIKGHPIKQGYLTLAHQTSDRQSMEVVMAIAAQDIQDDYAEHMHDYRQFVRIVQIVVAGVATVLLLLAFFLL